MTNAVRDYYSSVAPYYDAEMACRDDLAGWGALVRASGARRILDLGCGNGRVARAVDGPARDVVGVDLLDVLPRAPAAFTFVRGDLRALPFGDASFDLAIAANDPFAHVLDDAERRRALDEAARVARRVVIDGLRLTAAEAAAARAGGLARERVLPDGVRRCERWTALGDDRYRTVYRYVRGAATLASAAVDVRAWSLREPALRRPGVRLHGGVDGRPYDPDRAALVIELGEER